MKDTLMTRGILTTKLLQALEILFQPSINALERIRSKAHWSYIVLLLALCFLFSLGSYVSYVVGLYRDRSFTLHDIIAIVLYCSIQSILVPITLFIGWVVQYLVAILLRGKGRFLEHGWVDLVCFTPCVIAWACFLALPIPVNVWIMIVALLLLSGLLYACVLNIWMTRIMHSVQWKAALASTLLGYIAIPVSYMLILFFYLFFGIVELPHPS